MSKVRGWSRVGYSAWVPSINKARVGVERSECLVDHGDTRQEHLLLSICQPISQLPHQVSLRCLALKDLTVEAPVPRQLDRGAPPHRAGDTVVVHKVAKSS